MKWCWIGAAALSTLLVAGCSQPPPERSPLCHDIGASSGVTLQYDLIAQHHPRMKLDVKACLDSDCVRRTANRTGVPNAVILGRNTLKDESPRTVTLTITAPQDRVVFKDSTPVRPKRFQPNGPGCPPVVYGASINAFERDRLVVTKQEE
jgi:hypothetical protein